MTGRIADLPLDERRKLEIEKQRELADGLASRHLHITMYQQRYLAAQLARVPALAAKLRGE